MRKHTVRPAAYPEIHVVLDLTGDDIGVGPLGGKYQMDTKCPPQSRNRGQPVLDLRQQFLTLIALCSIALGKPTLSSLAVLGEISIAGTMLKVDELANALQVCLDSGAKKVLLPITSAADLGLVPADLIGCFNLVFYQSAEDAVYKALGVE